MTVTNPHNLAVEDDANELPHVWPDALRPRSAFPGPESVAQRLAAGEGWTGVVGDEAACPECRRQT